MLSVRTLADMARIITANLHRLDRGSYDCIVGVPRSGMIPANIIATMLKMPLADAEGYGRGIVHGRPGRPVVAGEWVLLGDHSCHQGGASKSAGGRRPPKTKGADAEGHSP